LKSKKYDNLNKSMTTIYVPHYFDYKTNIVWNGNKYKVLKNAQKSLLEYVEQNNYFDDNETKVNVPLNQDFINILYKLTKGVVYITIHNT
jgi:hypothetical protein